MDLVYPVFIGKMTSDWITQGFNWQLKVVNPETGKFKVNPKADSHGLAEHGAMYLNFKIHLMLEKGPKLLGRLGVAPINNMLTIGRN